MSTWDLKAFAEWEAWTILTSWGLSKITEERQLEHKREVDIHIRQTKFADSQESLSCRIASWQLRASAQ